MKALGLALLALLGAHLILRQQQSSSPKWQPFLIGRIDSDGSEDCAVFLDEHLLRDY